MKNKLTILVLVICFMSGVVVAQQKKEPYFSQVVATPNKALDFNLFLFHYKYQWIESKATGKYSRVSLVIQNKSVEPLNWKDYKIYLLMKDGTLFHNYTTKAKTGNYTCRYTVDPSGHNVQFLCFGKKFEPENVDRAWIKMTDTNFISLLYKTKPAKTSVPSEPRGSGGFATPPVIPNNPPSSLPRTRGTGSMAEARALLMKFLQPGVNHRALTQKLRPSEADYKAYFVASSWRRAMARYEEMWDQSTVALKPNFGQTELLLWKASVVELDEGTGNARKFPGGYKDVMIHINLGHTIYRFKFVQPGKTLGMAYDGLVFVNGHWVIFPKPWRIFN